MNEPNIKDYIYSELSLKEQKIGGNKEKRDIKLCVLQIQIPDRQRLRFYLSGKKERLQKLCGNEFWKLE